MSTPCTINSVRTRADKIWYGASDSNLGTFAIDNESQGFNDNEDSFGKNLNPLASDPSSNNTWTLSQIYIYVNGSFIEF